jgi:hypothetical protein
VTEEPNKTREIKRVSYHKHKNDEARKQYIKDYNEKNKDQIKEKRKIRNEKNKEKRATYNKNWEKNNKDKVKAKKKRYRLKHQNKIAEYNKKYKSEHKEEIKEHEEKIKDKTKIRKQNYYKENKERISEVHKAYRKNNKEKIHDYTIEYGKNNKEKRSISSKKYREENKEELNQILRNREKEERVHIIKLLGGKCVFCGEVNYKYLTLDHINDDGNIERAKHNCNSNRRIIKKYKVKGWPIEEIKQNLQILCYNCNFTKTRRNYFDLSYEEQSYNQRANLKLWKEAFSFFGPCKICGCDNLKFLSIDHIHNDGSEKRKNGEKVGAMLLFQFRKNKWPEYLKEDYQLLCFNCNATKEK